MIGLIADRLLQAALALLLLSMAVFLLTRATGSPLDLLLGQNATQEDYARLEKELGLDKPLAVQYGIYLVRIVQGDLGRSARSGDSVSALILDRAPASAYLALVATLIAFVGGVPLGVLAAVTRGRIWDTAITAATVVCQAAPSFWLGILLIDLFAVRLNILPAGEFEDWRSIVLPALTLGLFGLGGVVRLVRTSMLEVLDSEFVKLARAKGVAERDVVMRHALRNAMLSVVTYIGIYFSILVTLNAVVEVVFNWPGIGRMMFDAIVFRDFPLAQGMVLFAASVTIVVNLFVDIAYSFLDPRIRRQ
ncbi:MAG TPA: ABC transporter permease [Xanthobacteraceae bacterium]|nr:ABC transporter permease [Xanthobacteraceae bacterium]